MDALKLDWHRIATHLVAPLAALYVAPFLYTWLRVRLNFYRLRKEGMKAPTDAQEAMTFALLAEESQPDKYFYMDAWPFGFSVLVVTSPDLAVQSCQTHDLGKPDSLIPLIAPMSGGPTLFVQKGTEWEHGRALFHPGFSMRSVMGYIPYILQEVDVFVGVLRNLSRSGDTSTRFISQRRFHPIVASMWDTIDRESQMKSGNYFSRLSLVRRFKQWQNGRTMDHHIGIELEKRHQAWKGSDASGSPASSASKTIMDLAIAEYLKTRSGAGTTLDPTFKAWAVNQIRLFLFVGHDSTAVTIMYALYLLFKHPDILAKVRAEHDEVFGRNSSNTATLVSEKPESINKLPYTLAVVKETLRLFAPANALREVRRGVTLRDKKTGTTYPTEGFAILILHHAIHRSPQHWPEPHAFIPDHWLVEPNHPLYPPSGAWRPFEHGSRDCLGQTLALLDIQITLLITVREFDLKDQYAEWDRQHPKHGLNTVFGERAFMIQAGAGRPAQGMPCKVSLSARSQYN
ncbi:cytochrome P450 [Aspergillus stella-maris]|uniref:cytochrome P450 n=1 Tax=Aspergillus stella-maris TaxID=1810926 RepID=UPI003CCCCC59